MHARRLNPATEREVLVRLLKIDKELKKVGYKTQQVIVALRVFNYGRKPSRTIYIQTANEGTRVPAILGIDCEFVSDDIREIDKYSELFSYNQKHNEFKMKGINKIKSFLIMKKGT